VSDVPNAKSIVLADAMGRSDTGLTHIAVAVIYEQLLRHTPFDKLPTAMAAARYDFCVCTEIGPSDWQTGTIDDLLDALRRAQDVLASDDAVRQAAVELAVYLEEIAGNFTASPAICDRLVDILGIGSQEKDEDDDTD
jgi:hypothetical protein